MAVLWRIRVAGSRPVVIRAEVSCPEDMSVNSVTDLVFLLVDESLLARLRAILRVMVRNHWHDAITGCYAVVDSVWVCGCVCQGAADSSHRTSFLTFSIQRGLIETFRIKCVNYFCSKSLSLSSPAFRRSLAALTIPSWAISLL